MTLKQSTSFTRKEASKEAAGLAAIEEKSFRFRYRDATIVVLPNETAGCIFKRLRQK